MDYGDYDDDDDAWNDNVDLEALEAEAKSIYAATQQNRLPASLHASSQAGRPITEQNINVLVAEKQRFEKLARDKQGELNVLKSNIDRTSNEHKKAIDKVLQSHAATRLELSRKLEEYKDQITRLETDLVFQRQELKNARLKQSVTRTTSLLSPQKSKKLNGFPDKDAFEDTHTVSRNRKKRRLQHPSSTDDADLDAFELAERRAQERTAKLRASPMPSEDDLSRAASPVDHVMQDLPRAATPIVTEPKQQKPSVDKLSLYNIVLQAKTNDGNIIARLSNVKCYGDDSNAGAKLLGILTDPRHVDAIHLAEAITIELMTILSSTIQQAPVLQQILYLIHQLLFTMGKNVAVVLTRYSAEETSLGSMLSSYITSETQENIVDTVLHFFIHVAEILNRDEAACHALFEAMPTSFFKTVCLHTSFKVRILALQFLGKGAVSGSPLQGRPELLNLITKSLEEKQPDMLEVWTAVLQCLYAMLHTQQDGLSLLRKDRVVLPRLIKRIHIEVDNLIMRSVPAELMTFLEMAIKLYHTLMHEEACVELEAHWRSTFFRSAHIVAMTRVVFADEDDEFSLQAQEMARDLLELALSPEDGDDVYEVMATGSAAGGR